MKLLGSIAAPDAAAEAEQGEEDADGEATTEENPSVSAHAAAASTNAVYKRSLVLLIILKLLLELLRKRLLALRMGIDMKKTKTRRPSWRRLASEQRRCLRQLITLSGLQTGNAVGVLSDPFLPSSPPRDEEEQMREGISLLFSSPAADLGIGFGVREIGRAHV